MLSLYTRLRNAALVRCWRFLGAPILEGLGVHCGRNLRLYGWPIVHLHRGSRVDIGANVVLVSDSRFTALGVAKALTIRTLRPGAELMIGDNTGISGGSICSAVSVRIGKRCLLGADVIITDTDFHSINPVGRRYNRNFAEIHAAPVEIGNDVFIGTRAIILKGVSIGNGSIVGAAAVVTRSVEPGSIVAGNPARLISQVPGYVKHLAEDSEPTSHL